VRPNSYFGIPTDILFLEVEVILNRNGRQMQSLRLQKDMYERSLSIQRTLVWLMPQDSRLKV